MKPRELIFKLGAHLKKHGLASFAAYKGGKLPFGGFNAFSIFAFWLFSAKSPARR